MAVGGAPAATFQTVPSDNFFVIAPDLFEDATIPNIWSSKLQAIPGFSQSDGFDIPGRGLLAEVEAVFTGTVTLTPGTGSITATDYYPYGLFDNFRFSVNGSPLLNAQGLAFEYRRQAITRKSADASTSAPTSTGANTTEIHWLIPVADNMVNLWGAILTQADDLYVRLDYTQAALSKLFALAGNAAVTITGNLQLTFFVFDVPEVPIANMGVKGVLPDTDVLHRFSEYSVSIVANGDTELKLQQTGGEVERVFLFIDNVGSLMDPSTWNTIRFQFAETEEPIVFPSHVLLNRNSRNYTGKLAPKGVVLDFAYWNQRRDALYPKGIANPKVIVNLPSSITPNAGARFYGVQESLVGGA